MKNNTKIIIGCLLFCFVGFILSAFVDNKGTRIYAIIGCVVTVLYIGVIILSNNALAKWNANRVRRLPDFQFTPNPPLLPELKKKPMIIAKPRPFRLRPLNISPINNFPAPGQFVPPEINPDLIDQQMNEVLRQQRRVLLQGDDAMSRIRNIEWNNEKNTEIV